jgi:Flp pilus assembly protein TadD
MRLAQMRQLGAVDGVSLVSIRPDDAEALNIRAAALLEQGRPQEALASCDRVLAIRPDFVEALNNRAVALGQLGRAEEALASLSPITYRR